MQHLMAVLTVLAVAVTVTALLLLVFNRRARTPEERAERDGALDDELSAGG